MALINKRTGFYGFTLDGLNGIKSDDTGSVKKCIISFAYQVHLRNVTFSISGGAEDWGAQMGDGSIIPLSNPNILYVNRDSAIVEFDMAEPYAANSPCILVYRSDTATFRVIETDNSQEVYENTLSGHFAFTTEGYGGNTYDNGYVDRILSTIPFPTQVADVEFSISAGDDHWGARMGDGSIIPLKNPEVLVTNADNAVVKFEMTTPYPSNSPCMIVYRSPEATFHLNVVVKPPEYVAVTDITEVPTELTAGTTIDLSPCYVLPTDATVQGISWMVMSGPATIDGDSLTTTGTGNVVLKATVPGGLTEEGEDFTKSFTIPVKANTITILAQPTEEILLTHGAVVGSISVTAKSSTGIISYKWYRNTVKSYSGATPVHNGNKANYTFPVNSDAGVFYYFCEVSSPGANTVRTNMSKVSILIDIDFIKITPRPSSMIITQESKFDIEYLPANAIKPPVTWKSSDSNVIQIDDNGNALVINEGTVTLTATTMDGRFSDNLVVNVPAYVSVSNISGLVQRVTTGIYTPLSGTVIPSNSTAKNIEWSLVDAGTTGATVANGRLYATTAGTIVLKATIAKGISPTQDFIKEFSVVVDKAFVPVTDITLVNFPTPIRADQTANIEGKVFPSDADNQNILWTINNPGSTGASITDGVISFTNPGTMTLLATILNGTSAVTNFTKEFTIKVNDPWTPVSHIELTPTTYDPNTTNGEAITLSAIVYPRNASKTDVLIEMVDPSIANAVFDASKNTLQVDPKNMTHEMDPVVIFKLTVIDGLTEGKDYTSNQSIQIIPPAAPDVYVPLSDIDVEFPNPMRCHYPVLLDQYTVYPWNATETNIQYVSRRAQEYGGADNVIFKPSETEFDHLQKKPFFDWDRDERYLFPYDPGKITLDMTVIKGLGPSPGEDFHKTYNLEMLPPYIGVKDVSNIPLEIPVGKDVILSGELETNGGINYHNPTWDEEIPSFTNILWRIGESFFDNDEYPNNAGAVLKGDGNRIIRCNYPGEFTIQAYVENGTADAIQWYDKTQAGEAFTKLFTIRAISNDTSYDKAICTLTLNTGSKVRVYSMNDLNNLCNDLPSNYTLTINGTSFRKDQVTAVDFWEESYKVDNTIAVKDISFTKQSLENYELVAPSVETDLFSEVIPVDDPDGCITIMDRDSVFYGMQRLPDNVFMNPDGTIIRYAVPPVDDKPEEVTQITFKIEGTEYTADSNMTWDDWCNSSYNTDEFVSNGINISKIIADEIMYVAVDDEGTRVISSDKITADHEYVTGIEDATINPEIETLSINGEDLILNLKYASNIFQVDPSIIHFPDTFTRYDNGWVKIPEGTILDTHGNLIVPNPEYGLSTFKVLGTVTYIDGTPYEGAKVKLMEDDHQFGNEVTTDADGKFTFTKLPMGNYVIIADNGYGKNVSMNLTIDGETELVELKFNVKAYTAIPNVESTIVDTQPLSDLPIDGIATTSDDTEVPGTFSWVTADDDFDHSVETGTATWVFTPDDQDMYMPVYGTVTLTIVSHVIEIPSIINDKFVYNGNTKSPSWKNYDSSKMTIGGDTSATEVDMYYTTFKPKGYYTWEDESQSTKSISWGIYKSFTITSSNRDQIGYTGMDGENLIIPETFIKEGIQHIVTGMNIHTFDSCDGLELVYIPGTMDEVAEMAFDQCDGLKKVIIGEGVTKISSCAFQECGNLEEVDIPSTVTVIEVDAFKQCSNLDTVNYNGTEEQWDDISIASGNSNLKNATINYEEPESLAEDITEPNTSEPEGSDPDIPTEEPEQGTTEEEEEGDYSVYPMLYEISIHGVVFDHTTSRVLLPDGSCIMNATSILLPHDHTYNPENTHIDPVSKNSRDVLVKLPYGTYVNSSKQICILNNIKSTLDGMTAAKTDTGNFVKFSDGSLIHESGIVFTSGGKLFDVYQREISENSYFNLTKGTKVTPQNATNKNINWTVDEAPEGTVMAVLPTNGGDTLLIIAGNKPGYMVLDAYINNGFSNNNDYDQKLLIIIGDTSMIDDRLIAINMESVSNTVYKGYSSKRITLSIDLLGTSSNIENVSARNIQWSIQGGYKSGNSGWGGMFGGGRSQDTTITPSEDNLSAELYISRWQSTDSTITVTVKCGNITNTCDISIATMYSYGEPYVGSLRNFGRNFINLRSLNHIPSTVNGDDCLRNFLMGCTNFNQTITIPNSVGGDRCLKYFMRDCTSFNSKVTIPNEVYGDNCLHGFMYGCTNFNKAIDIPANVTGNGCLERFLMGCKSFNQNITIPEDISGNACLRNFMTECASFNRPIRIPDKITGEHSMDLFMRDCNSMTSNVSITTEAARNVNVNGQTLSTVFSQSNMFVNGVPIVGDGARLFMRKAYNVLGAPPYRHLTTTEPEDTEYTVTINQVEGVIVTPDLDAAFEIDTVTLTVEITDPAVTNVELTIDDPDVELVSVGNNIYEFIMGVKNVTINVNVTRVEIEEPATP